jgi:hypothetical protein
VEVKCEVTIMKDFRMIERDGKPWWEWVPGWMPIVVTLLSGIFYIGSWVTRVNASLENQSRQIDRLQQSNIRIEQYLKISPFASDFQSYTESVDPALTKMHIAVKE